MFPVKDDAQTIDFLPGRKLKTSSADRGERGGKSIDDPSSPQILLSQRLGANGQARRRSRLAQHAKGPTRQSPVVLRQGQVRYFQFRSRLEEVGLIQSAILRQVERPRPAPKASARVQRHISKIRKKLERFKNVASENGKAKSNGAIKERIVVMVRDPFWLHAYWEIKRHSVERVQAAMGAEWHTAKPILRLLEVHDGGSASVSERVVRDIEIHGGVSNWYVHVDNSPSSYRLELGYTGSGDRFFPLVRSNVVTTPEPGSSDAIDENWSDVAENFDKIYAMSGGYSPDNNSLELQELFEERLRRPMGSPMVTRYGAATPALLNHSQSLRFEVDAEMIVYGVTNPDTHVSLRGEPVKIRPDGTFTVRMSLPNQRQVIPVVASAANGAEQRTIVLAVERNTKVMEPLTREANE